VTAYPIAATPQAAMAADVTRARTERDAGRLAGAAVRFVVCVHPEVLADIDALDERFGQAFSEGWASRTSQGEGWQAAIRFWRPEPPLPIATTVKNAAAKPVGFAVTQEEASRLALAPTCLRTSETLRTYKSRSNALKAAGGRYYDGTAEIHLEEDLWAVRLTYWRIPPRLPDEASLTDKDREAVARGLNAPLRPSRPQTTEPMGLFAWEPAHVLMTGRADGLVAPSLILAEEDEEGPGFRMQDSRHSMVVEPGADALASEDSKGDPPRAEAPT
jgi:hypothetical protein